MSETYYPRVIEETELVELESVTRDSLWAMDWLNAKGTLDLIATIRHWQDQAFKPKETK